MPNAAQLATVLQTTRPPFLILSPICVFLGLSLSHHFYSDINYLNAFFVCIATLCAHISVNTFNEYFDFKSGLDEITQRTPFSGGSGGLPENPQALSLVLMTAVATLLVCTIIGLYLVSITSPYLVILGLIGVATIVLYTQYINRSPWMCLISPGVGFGLLFVVGTFIAVSPNETLKTTAGLEPLLLCIWASLVPYFLVSNLLLLNQLPDVSADKTVGRRTLPIVYGEMFALHVFLYQSLACAAVIILGVLLFNLPITSLISLGPLLALTFIIFSQVKTSQFKIDALPPALGKNVLCVLSTIAIYAAGIYWAS